VLSVACCPGSARGGHFSKGLADYNIGNVQPMCKKDYENEEEVRAQHRSVEIFMNK
jgi:hypothetical protein